MKSGLNMSVSRAIMAIAVVLAAAIVVFAPSPAAAIGSYPNTAIADRALTYVGQWGGQCRAFVNNVVWDISAHTQNITTGGDYFQSFLNAGGQELTSLDQLTRGDIVQVGQGVHTFIIVARISSSTFNVVDSNHSYNELVQNYNRTFTLSSSTRAFRMGSITAGPAPEVAVELVHHWQSGSGATDVVRMSPAGVSWGGVSAIGPVVPGAGQFGLGHLNNDGILDLYLVSTQGNPSGQSAIFVAAGPSYTNFLITRSTPMGQFDSSHGDVVIADFTGDGKADIGVFFANNGAPKAAFGILNAATEFQTWSYLAEVPIGGHDGAQSDAVAGDFDANGSVDLAIGFHQGTPSGNVDLFTLSGSASYQSVSGTTLPVGGWLDGRAQLLSGRLGGPTDRLAVAYTQETPTGSPDLFVLNGTSVSSWTLPVGYAPAVQRVFIGR